MDGSCGVSKISELVDKANPLLLLPRSRPMAKAQSDEDFTETILVVFVLGSAVDVGDRDIDRVRIT